VRSEGSRRRRPLSHRVPPRGGGVKCSSSPLPSRASLPVPSSNSLVRSVLVACSLTCTLYLCRSNLLSLFLSLSLSLFVAPLIPPGYLFLPLPSRQMILRRSCYVFLRAISRPASHPGRNSLVNHVSVIVLL